MKEFVEGEQKRKVIIEDLKSKKGNRKCVKRNNEPSSEEIGDSDDGEKPGKDPGNKSNYRRGCKCGCKDMGKGMTEVENKVCTLKEILSNVTASEEERKKSVQSSGTVRKQQISQAENP